MEYISSDTNVWLDFETINRLDYPFRLPYIYLMYNDAVQDELLSPPGLGERLKCLGLRETELTEEEFFLAEEYMERFAKPSIYDCVALAIAKIRGIILLTGDGPLRKAAKKEGVRVMGTIGIIDQLYETGKIDRQEYVCCLEDLLSQNGGKVRLPEKELIIRLSSAGDSHFE